MKTMTDVGIVLPQANEYLSLSHASKGKDFQGKYTMLTPLF
jgi:hypothetical protein